MYKGIVFAVAILLPRLLIAQSNDTLYVYGPGGPLAPFQECGRVFTQRYHIPVKVSAGPESDWIADAKIHADLFFGGAEYMLTQFEIAHPDLALRTSRIELYKRAAGILVRPGNPKHIHSLQDLAKPGIKILDVNGAGQLGLWEDLAGQTNSIAGIASNIAGTFGNSALGIDAWKMDKSYDAWVTFSSWHYRLREITELVPITGTGAVYRGTPVEMSATSKRQHQVKQFMELLRSPEGHAIFKKWGWE
ncbi:substrate-binding domain-containing protein [Mucilaginibacter sp. PAMB04274]|uniref:substrate-binding domain-containing protein n=1 Tax=Mucilaginibacter sp. PAMB04274 TaxID=3138568 RepID=UPI0031F6BEAA